MRNASLLIRSMRFMLEKWPRLVAEYKPAFGSIFEQVRPVRVRVRVRVRVSI